MAMFYCVLAKLGAQFRWCIMERRESIVGHSISMNGFHGKIIIITFTVYLQGTAVTPHCKNRGFWLQRKIERKLKHT